MKKGRKSGSSLGAEIERALSLLDPKGTDIQISQAMTIVRIAFAQESCGSRITSRSLYEKACQIYPPISRHLNT